MEPLTQLERRVYHYIMDFLAEHTYQPSIRDIAKHFRIKSTKTVSDLLRALQAKGFVERELTHLRRHGHTLPARVQVGVMVEVPALLYQLDELLTRVDFLSVGSNDLAQFMFAADRSNVNLAGRFDPISPPFLRALMMIVEKGRAADKPVTLCGELASQPIGALALIAIGYRSMSVSASAVGPVKAMLLDLDAARATALIRPLLDGARHKGTVREKLEAFATAEGLQL